MNTHNKTIWFWQLMVTPHMTNLAIELSRLGHDVHYCANITLSEERLALGWNTHELSKINLHYYSNQKDIINLLESMDKDSIHICQGIRSNGLVKNVQSLLSLKKIKYWVVMETVDDSGYLGFIKRLEYRRKIYITKKNIHGVLAIGEKTPRWLIARGFASDSVFPFAYFLEQKTSLNTKRLSSCFSFIYVGQLIPRKNVDLLIKALAFLSKEDFNLYIVGDGSDAVRLKILANQIIPNKVYWLGVVSMDKIPDLISGTDCLVLPSIHDGWGAVVSESLLVGTPAICSDSCGASEIVRASNVGGVFNKRSLVEITQLLKETHEKGKISDSHRAKIMEWSKSLSGYAGANYLLKIVDYKRINDLCPIPPWHLDKKKI